MSQMGTLWQVALRELTERSRSRAFRIASVVVLLLVVALVALPTLLAGDETEEANIGSVGEGNDLIIVTAEDLANANDEPGDPPSLAFTTMEFPDLESASIAIEDGEIEAAIVDGSQILVEGSAGLSGGSSLVRGLQQAAATLAIEEVVTEEGETATDIIEILTTDSLEVVSISGDDPEDDSKAVIAYAGLMLLYLAILLYGTWILNGVTEEKTNRVVEVLLSSVRPWQILGGKVLGIGTLAISQLLSVLIIATVAINVTGALDLPPIGAVSIINLLTWFVIGFLIYSVLFGAAGSLVSRAEDATAIAMPMSLVSVAGFFMSIVALDDPDGTVAVVGTLIPITAPFVVPVRAALDAIPVWQYGLAVVLCLATIATFTYIGGRIYAGGLLRYGQRVKLTDAWSSAE